MILRRSLISILLLFTSAAHAAEALAESDHEETPAYWDYGIGFGTARFAHYPAASQYSILALPAPTFQYRGRILRADERDGAHLYILKSNQFTIELSGTGSTALNSNNNEARQGMEDLPWVIALGPQAVFRPDSFWTFALGVFQATATDFVMTKFQGNIFEAKANYQWEESLSPRFFSELPWQRQRKLSIELQSATKEYHALYFDVMTKDARADREFYAARSGFLSHQLGYSESLKSGRLSLFAGAYVSSYAWSANRQSPLHKSDVNFTLALGMNYILGESKRPEIPADETSGLINRLRLNQKEYLQNID